MNSDGLLTLLDTLRLFLGIIFVLFIPGYSLQAALFPKQTDLDNIGRATLAFGLSIAVIPAVAVILDKLPWGIHPSSFVIGLLIVVVVSTSIALYRRQRLPPKERLSLWVPVNLGVWWREQDFANRLLYGAFTCALLGTLLSAWLIIAQPGPTDYFTEFYILGNDDIAENYFADILGVGQPVTVTVGVTNQEGSQVRYTVVVKSNNQIIGQSPIISLQDSETWERPIGFIAPAAGDSRDIQFVLQREGYAEPYRTLQLRVSVKPKPTPTPTSTPASTLTPTPTLTPTLTLTPTPTPEP